MFEALTSLLTVLEVVLSIDNLVVIAVLVGKLPRERQAAARYSGMTLALLPRLILLFFISWIIGLTEPLVTVLGHGVSGKDMILAAGGLFLIYKATQEIHASLEGEEGEASARVLSSFAAVVVQIALINLVFSIDSIVTAVGMANEIWVMAVAVILSMMVLMLASGPVAAFVEEHPTVKVLALGFLIMIGMALVADSFSAGVPKVLTELTTLGRTLKERAADVLAYFERPGTSNGPTEALNGRLEHLRGSALGFRNLTNYIARSLLETGGFRPQLHPRMR